MKTIILLSLSLLVLGAFPAASAKRNADGLYKDVISRHCRAVEHDPQERYTNIPWNISRNTIKIRSVRSVSRGWLRIYAYGHANGRLATGYVDYHPGSKQARCPTGTWIFNQKLQRLKLWD